jgi:peptidoglycan hydrolase-like protein with peptidoglycan-binding domain
MNPTVDERSIEAGTAGPRPPRRRRRYRKAMVSMGAVVVLGAAGLAVAGTHMLGQRPSASGNAQDNGTPVTTVPVARRSLSSQTSVAGTLGHAGSYTVLGQSNGTITWLPSAGQVIRQGQELYGSNGVPVVLLYGTEPAYRNLAEGTYASDVTGQDVRQLNRDLVALGYASGTGLDPSSDEFTWATQAAVKNLQQHLGVSQTGELDLGQVVFLPGAARVTNLTATLGGPADGHVLQATSTSRQVSVGLDAALQSEVKADDRATITLPDGHTTPGVVTSVGTVATSGSGANSTPTIPVAISLTDSKAGAGLDQAAVQVTITTATVQDVLAVPVSALLALAGGGYAVEVAGHGGSHVLVPVTTGLFDDSDGLVQVTGTGLTAGQRVVVPAS